MALPPLPPPPPPLGSQPPLAAWALLLLLPVLRLLVLLVLLPVQPPARGVAAWRLPSLAVQVPVVELEQEQVTLLQQHPLMGLHATGPRLAHPGVP